MILKFSEGQCFGTPFSKKFQQNNETMTFEQQIQDILDNIVGSKSKTDRKKEFISLKEALVQGEQNKLLYSLSDKSWSIVLETVIDFVKVETANQSKLKRVRVIMIIFFESCKIV